jgi:hypothetical protein
MSLSWLCEKGGLEEDLEEFFMAFDMFVVGC